MEKNIIRCNILRLANNILNRIVNGPYQQVSGISVKEYNSSSEDIFNALLSLNKILTTFKSKLLHTCLLKIKSRSAMGSLAPQICFCHKYSILKRCILFYFAIIILVPSMIFWKCLSLPCLLLRPRLRSICPERVRCRQSKR